MANPLSVQSLTSTGTTGWAPGASLTKPGDYPFQLSRQSGGDSAHHYYAVLMVRTEGVVTLQLSRGQSPDEAKASAELIPGVAKANTLGPSFGFHSPDKIGREVRLVATETSQGLQFIGNIDGWKVNATPAAFTRLQPPARPAPRPDWNPDDFQRNGRTGIQRDLCGRLVTAPFDFFTRAIGTRT